MSENPTFNAARDAVQSVINATTTLWYGTDDALTSGKALRYKGDPQFGTPPFVIVHPDDVSKLPPGARHIRDHALTRAEIAALLRVRRSPR